MSDHCQQPDQRQCRQRSQRRRANLQIPHEAFSPYIIGGFAILFPLRRAAPNQTGYDSLAAAAVVIWLSAFAPVIA
jgi:hypothetical protein